MANKIYTQELILENIGTAILLLDERLKLNYINPAGEALLGLSGKRMIGEHVDGFFMEHPGLADLERTLQSHQPFTKREARLVTLSGKQVVVDYMVSPMVGQPNQKVCLVIEMLPRDRLQRISRDEELISQHATTQVLVRGVAHEVKNPLGGIRGAAQLLSRELSNPLLEEYTNIIIEEVDRLRNLVDKMLGPQQLPQRTPTNVHEVLERVASLIEVEFDSKIALIRDYDPSIPDLISDPEQLIQTFLNIVRNAVQAIQSQPEVSPAKIILRTRIQRQFTIGAKRYRLVIRIDVEDNGPGIPEDIKNNLFYPMISGRAEGTGLGLSIAQSIISQLHGIIECESESGKTTFSIYLPLEFNHD